MGLAHRRIPHKGLFMQTSPTVPTPSARDFPSLCACGSGKPYLDCCLSALSASETPLAQTLARAATALNENRLDESQQLLEPLLLREPKNPDILHLLGLIALRRGQSELAITRLNAAIQAHPTAVMHYNLALAYKAHGLINSAIAQYEAALAMDPELVDAYLNLGIALKSLGDLQGAIENHQKALLRRPEDAKAQNELANLFQECGLLDEAVAAYCNALLLDSGDHQTFSNLIATLAIHPECDSAQYLEYARHFGTQAANGAKPFSAWQRWEPNSPPVPLHVGFLSGDLHQHPVAFFLERVLSKLDRQRFRLSAWVTREVSDATSERLRGLFSEWTPLAGVSDAQAAQMIHERGVDVLIDLSGHTAYNRLPIMAWKPAPVQVSWLGYFASTGVPAIDYVISDPVSTPEGAQAQFSERLWTLPHSRLCFSPPHTQKPISVGPLPALKNGHLTLGCFQRLNKMTERTLELWARVLAALPEAKLRVQCLQLPRSREANAWIQRLLEHGIRSERIVWSPPSTRDHYWQAYNEVDWMLDTVPFNGGTTTCEAMWMGVPTLTLAGDSMVGRQGASLLRAAGLDDWVARDEEDFVARAVQAAQNLPALSALRAGLREQLMHSPLGDANLFARNLEQALLGMWREKRKAT